MRYFFFVLTVMSLAVITSCDPRSEITKKSVEKYQPTPTPSIAPTATQEPVDPADVVMVDTSLDGDNISIDGPNQKKRAACTKFNRVMINNNDNEVTIKGACRQIMINGNRNKVTAEAIAEVVFNGSENNVKHSRFANGKRPIVTENGPGNILEKITAPR